MKSAFVADLRKLQKGQRFESLLLVCEKETRVGKNGKPYLHLYLADRTGKIVGRMWDNFAGIEKAFVCEDIVRVRGHFDVYQEQPQLILDQILPAAEAEYTLEDFLPHTKGDVHKLFSQLQAEISSIRNPWLARLLTSFADDPQIAAKLKRAPAAKVMHHAYLGGLLEHIVSLCGLAKIVAQHYPEVDADLLLTGVILHDIGKIEELSYKRAIGYTTEGELLGHIIIGLRLVQEKIAAIPEFPYPLAVLVEHLIVSHHGSLEFGSPKLPVTREAVLLNHLDDMDSKMAAVRETLAQAQAEDLWTERNSALRRSLLNSATYIDGSSRADAVSQVPAAASPRPQAAGRAGTGQLFGRAARTTTTTTAPVEEKNEG